MSSLGLVSVCGVCEERPKYRCPACRVPYCSVPCYKKHKEQCISNPSPVKKDSDNRFVKTKFLEDKGNDWSVADILDSDDEKDRVSIRKLKDLGDSKELRNLLTNPHLQQLLVSIDQAEDKETLMKSHMREPLFVEFADCCLRIVDPPEKENTLDVEG
ncbi:zinc finger HIT domain-containing protein 3 isoform X1 [Gracilinanus agilis]|uniref:zinc finger HIT domain-containing protein 3 isoform X1 n=1 Tax=Gracilinanus agilis TaxID=191870 RepID=UPI001CFE58D5|nr:zinc finger HIT domain-containing protein 3 isoform X1 [Gracilinanus agilis]